MTDAPHIKFAAAVPLEAGWNGQGMDALGLARIAAAKQPDWESREDLTQAGAEHDRGTSFRESRLEAPCASIWLPPLAQGAHFSPEPRLPGGLFDRHPGHDSDQADEDETDAWGRDEPGEHAPSSIDHEPMERIRL